PRPRARPGDPLQRRVRPEGCHGAQLDLRTQRAHGLATVPRLAILREPERRADRRPRHHGPRSHHPDAPRHRAAVRHGRSRPRRAVKKRRRAPSKPRVERSAIPGPGAFAYRFVKFFPPVTLRVAVSKGAGPGDSRWRISSTARLIRRGRASNETLLPSKR